MKDITVRPDITIRDAMKVLDRTAKKCLLVVDEGNKLLGTLTDGDLRRSILSGAQFSESIAESYRKEPVVLARGTFTREQVASLLREQKLDVIPVVDDAGIVSDYLTWDRIGCAAKSSNELPGVAVVIMAGGRGTRMEPFTKILPKPLVPIHDKPVIEHIIERFTAVGCNEFHLTVNYKGRIL